MSYLLVAPPVVESAADQLAQIEVSLGETRAAAAAPISGILVAAGDEVSAAIAALFSDHGRQFQALSTQAAALHDDFLLALRIAATAYGAAEAANANPLAVVTDAVLGVINAPTNLLLGRPLLGNGVDGAPGSGQAGGRGGNALLFGTGGAGGT
ncbi:PE family protein, partial [Mycobacterium intermedium]|uniref:PE family protein n=1 Tax=Mycobacterium intermedium TaxID=28445 RepID=UPI0039EB798C